MGTRQQKKHNHSVHQGVHHRVHKREDYKHLELGFNQFVVGLSEAELFIALPHTGFDDADARYVLLEKAVDLIQPGLEFGQQGACLPQAEKHAAQNQRKGTQHNTAKGGMETVQKEQAAHHQHGSTDHTPDKLGHKVLHLSDVIGYPSDQRTCSKPIHLRKGKR